MPERTDVTAVPGAGAGHQPLAAFTDRSGVVATFDEHLGAGSVTDAESGDTWFLHCTRILDGSRTVAVGAAVAFRAWPGPTGLEAVDVRPLAGR